MFEKQRILPAISTHKDLDLFLASPIEIGILMNFQLAQLPRLIKTMKERNKKVFIHLDLIKGLSNDEYGAIFLIQSLGVDGIISIKPRVIELCKKRNVFAIFRVFLKDSHSLKQSLMMIQNVKPDAVEILPAVKIDIIEKIKAHTGAMILAGGLIEDHATIEACMNVGVRAVTTSKTSLWPQT